MSEKITITDISRADSSPQQISSKENLLKSVIDEQKPDEITQENANTSPNLYSHTPATALEREINAVLMRNKEYVGKVKREKIFLSEFEKKMARLRRIKSKGYRKLRRKIKERHALESAAHASKMKAEDVPIPDFLLKELDVKEEEKKIMSFGGDEDSSSSSQEELVRRVFDDEFGEEFQKEKEALVAAKEEVRVLPGWGAWGGSGIDVMPTPVNTLKPSSSSSKRADSDKHHVILTENCDQSNKIMTKVPKNLNPTEYQAIMNIPISKEWNTARIFNKFVKGRDEKNIEKFKYQRRYTK